MYELLTGTGRSAPTALRKLLHQIVYATPPPISYAARRHSRGTRESRHDGAAARSRRSASPSGARVRRRAHARASATRAAQGRPSIDQQEQFDLLRRLRFFHDFSHGEIWEVLRASDWAAITAGDEIVREGELDDRFYIIVTGDVSVRARPRQIGVLLERRLLRRDELRARRAPHGDDHARDGRSRSCG